jgi:hypothetical protein
MSHPEKKSDEWKRFEDAVGKLVKSPPQPKTAKKPEKKKSVK